MHVHSYYSPCAHGLEVDGSPVAAPERYLRQAHALGICEIIFTDHFVEDPTAPGVVMYYKASGPVILEHLRQELARLEDTFGVTVHIGCETETMSTEWVGVSPELARKLAIVLAPCTHYHLPGVPQPASMSPKDVAAHMLLMLESLVSKPWIDAVAHPFAERSSLIGDHRAIYEAMDASRLTDILGLAARYGVALEINGSSVLGADMPGYPAMYREIVRQAKALGVRFTYGSDAHNYQHMGLSDGVALWIQQTGLEERDFVTTTELAARKA
jgi:histidinol phosphatase-like PHP family hydrolase